MRKRARNHKHLVAFRQINNKNRRTKGFKDVKVIQWKKACNNLGFIFGVVAYEPQGKRLN